MISKNQLIGSAKQNLPTKTASFYQLIRFLSVYFVFCVYFAHARTKKCFNTKLFAADFKKYIITVEGATFVILQL